MPRKKSTDIFETDRKVPSLRILIVDDEKECVEAVARAIEPAGYKCTTFTNPVKALASYKKNQYDAVISDVRMPEMNGMKLLKKLKKHDPSARVLIITAFGDLETAIQAINNKAYAFFGKPIDFISLLNTLKEIEEEVLKGNDKDIDYLKLQDENAKLRRVYDQLLHELYELRKEKGQLEDDHESIKKKVEHKG